LVFGFGAAGERFQRFDGDDAGCGELFDFVADIIAVGQRRQD
jgi:hypothetical protein